MNNFSINTACSDAPVMGTGTGTPAAAAAAPAFPQSDTLSLAERSAP